MSQLIGPTCDRANLMPIRISARSRSACDLRPIRPDALSPVTIGRPKKGERLGYFGTDQVGGSGNFIEHFATGSCQRDESGVGGRVVTHGMLPAGELTSRPECAGRSCRRRRRRPLWPHRTGTVQAPDAGPGPARASPRTVVIGQAECPGGDRSPLISTWKNMEFIPACLKQVSNRRRPANRHGCLRMYQRHPPPVHRVRRAGARPRAGRPGGLAEHPGQARQGVADAQQSDPVACDVRINRTVSRRGMQRTTQPGRPEGVPEDVPAAGDDIAIRRRMMIDHELGNVAEEPAPGGQIEASSSSSPPMKNRDSNPPASRNAERRMTQAPARKPSSG